MEQHTLKNVSIIIMATYLETSRGQSFNPYLNVAHVFVARVDWKSVAA
jgi:hypothetical protein